MKTKKAKIILGGCCLALTILAATGCASSIRADAYTVNLSEELSYSFGDTFLIPNATIEYEGTNIPVTKAALVYPDGVMIEGDSHFIQAEGVYKIIYYANVSGKVISAEKTFEVVADPTENEKPTITLDSRFVDGAQYKIAINESVTIPEATITDDNLVGGVKMTVYYNYGMPTQQIIGIKDGTFTPTKVGEHAIVYSAVDAYGEKAEEVVFVTCAIAEDNVAAKLFAENATGNAGEEVEIAQCELVGLYDEAFNLRVFATFENETVKEEIFDYRYFPRNVGEYQIIYEFETPFKTYSTTSKLTTLAAGNIEINEAPLPNYFIKGASYTLDDWVGYVFSEKYPVETVAKTYMKEDDGNYAEINHKDFKVNASSTVRFKFEIGSKSVETQSFKVVDVGFGGALKLTEYFQGEGFIKGENAAEFTVKDGEGNYTLDFINVLSLSSFSFEFTVPKTEAEKDAIYDEFQAIDITLTDYYDRDKQVTASYRNVNGLLAISFNGGANVNTGRTFSGVKNTFFYSKGAFSNSSGHTWALDNAFESDKLLLSVTLVGVDGNAGITVQRLASQGFNATSDRIEADIYYENPQGGMDITFNYETYYTDCMEIDTNVRNKLLKAYDVTDVPDFEMRASNNHILTESHADYDKNMFMERMRYVGNRGYDFLPVHTNPDGKYEGIAQTSAASTNSTKAWLLPAVYDDEVKYPEAYHWKWFSTEGDELCFTARGDEAELEAMLDECLWKATYSLMKYTPDKYPEKNAITLTQQDNTQYCRCTACTEKAEELGGIVGVYIDFMNKLAERVENWMNQPENAEYKRENLKFYFFAYSYTLKAPVKYNAELEAYEPLIKCRDNVGAFLASKTESQQHITSKANEEYLENIDNWGLVTKNINYWFYGANFKNYMWFHDSFEQYIPEFYSHMATRSNAKMFIQGQEACKGTLSNFNNLKVYLEAKLEWDSSLDYGELIDNFFNAMYREAAPAVKKVYLQMRANMQDLLERYDKFGGGDRIDFAAREYWPLATHEGLLKELDEAKKLVERYNTFDEALYEKLCQHIEAECIAPLYLILDFHRPYLSQAKVEEYISRFRYDIEWMGLQNMTLTEQSSATLVNWLNGLS